MEGNRELHLIGVGGVGGWILQALVKSPLLVNGMQVIAWDKDKVEEKNLSRQFFAKKHIGKPKVNAFAETIKNFPLEGKNEWFTQSSGRLVKSGSIIVCAADNHGARLSALQVADLTRSVCIIAANETIEAESYIYLPEWENTERDPRVYYPILKELDPFDPAAPRCNDTHIVDETPQLAIANMLAASYALFLLHLYASHTGNSDGITHKINNTSKKIFSTKKEVKFI